MIKYWGALMAIWFAFAFFGAIADGKVMTGSDYSNTNALNQGVITTAPTSTNIVAKWIGAGTSLLTGVANVLTLNFSLYDGGYSIIRWFGLACLTSPIWLELIARIFGRA